VLAAEMTLAKGAVADDALSGLTARSSGAANSLRRHGVVCFVEFMEKVDL
jgi:hypothetical protein